MTDTAPAIEALLTEHADLERQLADPNIAERVIGILRRTGLRASTLELEITENLLLQPTDDILRLLNDLTELGVRLTVDDFGIGYSSLSYLHRYPIKALKIDRSFISRIGIALHNDTIVEAIIALAQRPDRPRSFADKRSHALPHAAPLAAPECTSTSLHQFACCPAHPGISPMRLPFLERRQTKLRRRCRPQDP